jgi:hypothetical protein
MTHLTREELQRWWREGRPADRDRILGHLAECDECGALYGEVIDTEQVEAGSAAAFPEVVPRGYRAYRGPGGAWRSPQVLAGLAAAAAILIALIVPALRHSADPDAPVDRGIRGTSLQPLAPIGAVPMPVVFRWTSPVLAARYAVEIRDEGGLEPLFTLSTTSETVALPRDSTGRLKPGRTYTWEVVAFGPGGEEIMRAPARAFVVSDGVR